MTHVRSLLGVAFCLLSVAGCEKIDLEEEGGGGEPVLAQTLPQRSGEGTQESPLMVEQVINSDTLSSRYYWVIGYVVGSTYRTMNNAVFEATTTYDSNILLASDSTCTSVDRCIPVELKSSKIQQIASLPNNPGRHRQCIMVQGQYGRYFNRPGLRETRAAYWLPGFDISTIVTAPIQWNERDSIF